MTDPQPCPHPELRDTGDGLRCETCRETVPKLDRTTAVAAMRTALRKDTPT